jgi:hypothetical protein
MQTSGLFLSILVLLSSSFISLSYRAKYDFRRAEFPCETECQGISSGQCFSTNWKGPAALSRSITTNCTHVLYGISLGSGVGGIHGINDYWDGNRCSIMFLSSNSTMATSSNLKDLDRVGNWSIILVGDLTNFGSLRRAGKIPKLAPNYFFDTNVEYAIYLDSKYSLHVHPTDMIRNFSAVNSSIVLTAFRHPKNANIHMEYLNILKSSKGRPTISDDIGKVSKQYYNYTNNRVIKHMRQSNISQVVIEAGMLIHKLNDRRGVVLRCSWLHQVQLFSDRDQVAFPFVIAQWNQFIPYLNHTIHNHPAYKDDSFMIPLDFEGLGGMGYLNLIPQRYYWRKKTAENFGNISYETWHQKIDIYKGAETALPPMKPVSLEQRSLSSFRKTPQKLTI